MTSRFINDNPRYLSGGMVGSVDDAGYEHTPVVITVGHNRTVSGPVPEGTTIADYLSEMGQCVHRGTNRYHDRPALNVFLRDDDPLPSAGVELEMILRGHGTTTYAMHDDLRSNWFHFETDSSLTAGEGHELITEPLPSEAYRDIDTWLGLQNICTRHFESWRHSCTGLHVHVGVRRFDDCDRLPAFEKTDRRLLGKAMAIAIYYGMIDRSLVNAVMHRNNGTYCTASVPSWVMSLPDGVKAAEYSEMLLANIVGHNGYTLLDSVFNRSYNRSWNLGAMSWSGSSSPLPGSSGHGSEINTPHRETIEFRRGKGTLNGVTIHEIVEFATGVVRLAEFFARNPDERVDKRTCAEWLRENTNSDALRKAIDNTGKGA